MDINTDSLRYVHIYKEGTETSKFTSLVKFKKMNRIPCAGQQGEVATVINTCLATCKYQVLTKYFQNMNIKC